MSANVQPHAPVAGGIVTIEEQGKGQQQEYSTAPVSSARDPITITRRINIKIQGSMSDFAQDGQGSATWRAVDGKQAAIWGLQDILGSAGSGTGASATHNSVMHALGSAVIQNAVLLEHKSTFRVPLGVTINCLPSNEMTGFGEAYCYTVLPESTNTVPIKLFESTDESEEGNRWRKEYPKYNQNNLEKHGVLETTDCAYVFVHQKHPVIALLRVNKDLLGTDIDKQQKIDNEWYKVHKDTFATCCNTLRHKVLSKVSTKDLNAFSVEISRIGTRDWLDLQDGEDALSSFRAPPDATPDRIAELEAKHLEDFCEQKCSYHARLEITFEVQP